MRKVGLLLLLITTVTCLQDDKRFIIDTIANALNIDGLKEDLQVMADVLGIEPTEAACEIECQRVITEKQVLQYACPLLCRSFQTLLHFYDISTPPIPDPEG